MSKFKIKLNYTQIIALSFIIIILTGAILLCLPISSRDGTYTPFINSLFTATSATCVTGLVVYDTFTHWSLFGQIVILSMIQIGGLGFMTVISMFMIFFRQRISLHERRLLMQSAGTLKISGVVALIKRIAFGTMIFEFFGAIALAVRFCPQMGLLKGIYNAIFHSISAFCNAGFDLFGKYKQFSSLTTFADDPVVNITIMLLIIIGGIGFIVWSDILKNKFNFKKYELHSKIVLTTTLALIFGSTVLFFIFEYNNAFADMNLQQKILASFFQSVTPRTAGFNTIDLTTLSESGNMLTVILMFIGGSPGSTAGGIKTTTLIVLILSAIASSKNISSINIFKRKLEDDVVKQATAIITIYLIAVLASTMLICAIEPLSFEKVVFEVTSAAGTVGLSMGITSMLSVATKAILMILMFGGRVGGLTLMLLLAEKKNIIPIERPVEKILIG